MKRYFMLFLAAAAAFMSCQISQVQDPLEEPEQNPQEEMLDVKIQAGILTKTVLDGTTVLWEPGDQLAMVFAHETDAPHVNKSMVNAETEKTAAVANFNGRIPMTVSVENGYEDEGFVVYPHDAVAEDGTIQHNLPAVQEAKANGSFPSGCNLASATVSLSDLRGDEGATADFVSAMSLIRMTLSPDIESVMLTGTAPLTGVAPVQMGDDGLLAVNAEGAWSEESASVTLLPAEGASFEEKTYNLLVWPGTHEGFTICVNFKNLGEYVKTSSKAMTFKPAKYYNLNFKNTEELVIEEVEVKLEDLEQDIPNIDELDKTVAELLAQVQSVTLMTEYLDNAVYARYAQMTYSKEKIDLSLDYIVKPEAAAEALVEAFNQDPNVVSGVLAYGKGSGLEVQSGYLSVKEMYLNEIPGIGKVVTAAISAVNIHDNFYNGTWEAAVALQIAHGQTDIVSDFANLVPMAGSLITGKNVIPAVPGARVVIPFSYAVSGENGYELKVTETENVANAWVNYNDGSKTGNLNVVFAEGAIQSPCVTLTLTAGDAVVDYKYTFVDNGGRIEVSTSGDVDWIGGDAVVDVTSNLGAGTLMQTGGTSVSFDNAKVFTFGENTGGERTANVQFSVMSNSVTYYKDIVLTQKAKGSALSRTYYRNGQKVVLNQANASGCSNYFNIVILGDGYKKKDLAQGGKFERSARSAMDSFFAIEPYKSFKDRFNVYMVAYESEEEGTDVRSSGITKNTYFNSYCQGGGNTAAYIDGADKVVNAVKAAVGSSDAIFYRSIAILLLNTDEQAGSTGYPFRDYKSGFANGYASFAIAVLAANSIGTNGLVKHEAGGHAFGRLADEYYSAGTTASETNKTDLNNWHAKGWYWNVTPRSYGNYYKFTTSDYDSSEVDFIEGAWWYAYGIYRPTAGGMMQGNSGVFNAPSRHAIYHRIITESEGVSAYSWSKFLIYDKKNR